MVETSSDVEMSHCSATVSSLSWTTSLQDTESAPEDMLEGVFTLPQLHKSFKEYIGNKTDLSRAVIPAAILAGYTGRLWLKKGHISFRSRLLVNLFSGSLLCFLPICFNRKRSHSTMAIFAGTSHRSKVSLMYMLDRRWVGVQADRP